MILNDFIMKTKDKKEHDWFDDLTEEQQQAVNRALGQLDRGEGIPHEEAMARFGYELVLVKRSN
ncbi:MAG: hypothetical protein JWP44_4013 [Mucilaginibacter sp.]|nr:hypothetical protein [Mucilaginibacter sp.]